MGDGKEGHIVFGGSLHVGILGLAGHLAYFLIGRLAEFGHHGKHLLFLHVAQQAVEIHVEGLQEEVGGHKAGEVVIVVPLIDVEQLVFLSGHNGKSLTAEGFLQSRVEGGKLEGVHDIGNVHQLSGSAGEIISFQFILARFQFGHESLFLLGITDRSHAVGLGVLLTVFFVFLTVPEAFFQYGVVPGSATEDTAQVGIHEAVALAGRESIAKDAQVAETVTGNILVEIYLTVEFLHIQA